MPQDESWSWKKFFKGFVTGKNYGKSLVLMFCMAIILVIGVSVYEKVSSWVGKRPTVGTNTGTIVNEDSRGNSISLFNLFNWR